MADPIYPDFLGTQNQQWAQGQQRQSQRLAGQAYNAAPDQRQAALSQLAGIDVGKAAAIQKNFDQQDTDHLAKFSGAIDYMGQALKSGNQQQIQGAYQAVRPYLLEKGLEAGADPNALPQQWSDSMLPAFYQAQATIGKIPDKSHGVVINGSLVNDSTGETMASIPYPLQYQNAAPNGQGTAAGFANRNNGTLAQAIIPGQTASPQASPSQPAMQTQITPASPQNTGAADQATKLVQGGMDPAQAMQKVVQSNPGQKFQLAYDEASKTFRDVSDGSQQTDPVSPTTAQPSAPAIPSQFGVSTPKDSAEIATLKAMQGDPSLLKTYQALHPSAVTGGMGKAPSGYRWSEATGGLEPIPGGPADKVSSGMEMSADAIDNAAWDSMASGKPPPIGRGDAGLAQKTAILNRKAEIAKAAGVSPAELSTIPGRNKAFQSSLAVVQKRSDAMETSEKAFQNNTQVAMDLSANLARTGSPALNKWILGAKAQMGDPDVQALDAAITTMSVDYARIMSGATGSGGTPISTAEEAKSLIRKELSHQSLSAVVNVLNQDIAGQQSAVHDQRGKILAGMQQMHDASLPTSSGLSPTPTQNQAPAGTFTHLWK